EFAVVPDRNMGPRRQPALLDRGRVGNEFHVRRRYSAIIDDRRALRCRSVADDALILPSQSFKGLHEGRTRLFAIGLELEVSLRPVEAERRLLGKPLIDFF